MKITVLDLDLQPVELGSRSFRADRSRGADVDDDIVVAAERNGIKRADIISALSGTAVIAAGLSLLGVGTEAASSDGEGGYQNERGTHGDPPTVLTVQYTRCPAVAT